MSNDGKEIADVFIKLHSIAVTMMEEHKHPIKYLVSGFATCLMNSVMMLYNLNENEARKFVLNFFTTMGKVTEAAGDPEEESRKILEE